MCLNDNNLPDVSIKQELEDMLINGYKYGINFIVGESNLEKCTKLRGYNFNLLELDCIEVNNIVTGLRETEKVLAWSSNKPEEIDSFLERESPMYRVVKSYRNTNF